MLGQWGNDHSTDIQLQKTWMSKLIINAYLNRSMVGGQSHTQDHGIHNVQEPGRSGLVVAVVVAASSSGSSSSSNSNSGEQEQE